MPAPRGEPESACSELVAGVAWVEASRERDGRSGAGRGLFVLSAKGAIVENLLTPDLRDQYGQIDLGFGANFEFHNQFFYAFATSELGFGTDLPQGRVNIGPELGTIMSSGTVKATASIGMAKSVFDGNGERTLRVSQGFSWAISKDMTLIQSINWIHTIDKDLTGTKFKLGIRFYF